MQQQQEPFADFKRNFNITNAFCTMHQRALTVPLRHRYGLNALGLPCLLAFVLMCFWAAFTQDILMWGWVGIWLVCQLIRRVESVRLYRAGEPIHTQYDGWPSGTVKMGRNENAAKLIVEPLIFGVVGWILYQIYLEHHWHVYGLPYFFMAGVFSLPFVEIVKRTIWERRTQSMSDARIEQQEVVNNYRDKFGEL